MQIFQSKYNQITGSSYSEIIKVARHEHRLIQKRTPKRQPYVRSQYFKRDKIFINDFWKHLEQKNWADRTRRLKLFRCAIDLIRHTLRDPEIKQKIDKRSELLYRFTGMTGDGKKFYVQIKEDKRTGRKDFLSVFPAK